MLWSCCGLSTIFFNSIFVDFCTTCGLRCRPYRLLYDLLSNEFTTNQSSGVCAMRLELHLFRFVVDLLYNPHTTRCATIVDSCLRSSVVWMCCHEIAWIVSTAKSQCMYLYVACPADHRPPHLNYSERHLPDDVMTAVYCTVSRRLIVTTERTSWWPRITMIRWWWWWWWEKTRTVVKYPIPKELSGLLKYVNDKFVRS